MYYQVNLCIFQLPFLVHNISGICRKFDQVNWNFNEMENLMNIINKD